MWGKGSLCTWAQMLGCCWIVAMVGRFVGVMGVGVAGLEGIG